MLVTLKKTFGFESAHSLPHLPDGHKCRRIHGHSFRVEVAVRGPVDPHTGIYMDYADISAQIEPLRTVLDHCYLNEIEGLENPSSEVLAGWIWQRLEPSLPGLILVTVMETCTSACSYDGS